MMNHIESLDVFGCFGCFPELLGKAISLSDSAFLARYEGAQLSLVSTGDVWKKSKLV